MVRIAVEKGRADLEALPEVQGVAGPHVPVSQVGNLLFLSGVLPLEGGAVKHTGQIGGSVSIDSAKECGRLCALQALARASDYLGGLERIQSTPKVTVFLNCTSDFEGHSDVANSVSATLEQYLGGAGRHARSAIGVGSLPKGAPVEVEVVFEATTGSK